MHPVFEHSLWPAPRTRATAFGLALGSGTAKGAALQPQDTAALQAAFHRLSADLRYTRFMISLRELSEAMLEAAMHPVPGREFALVAVSAAAGKESIVGSARYVGAPASDT